MIKIDNYLSYEIKDKDLNIYIKDKYFPVYPVLIKTIELLHQVKSLDTTEKRDKTAQLKQLLDNSKSSDVQFPLVLDFRDGKFQIR